MNQSLYVYAIAPAPAAATDLGTGIDGADLDSVEHSGLVAVVHACDGKPYVGPDETVRGWILEHSTVVDRVWEQAGTVLPVSFNVIVAGEEDQPAEQRLTQWLEQNAQMLQERLTQLQGASELRVGISLDLMEASEGSEEIRQLQQQMQDRPSGVQRLYQRRLEEARRRIAEARAEELYPEWRARILQHATEFSAQRSYRSSQQSVPVLDLAVLVTEEQTEPLGRELAAIQQEQAGTEIKFLGPWPPYSFVELAGMGPQGTNPSGHDAGGRERY